MFLILSSCPVTHFSMCLLQAQLCTNKNHHLTPKGYFMRVPRSEIEGVGVDAALQLD